MSSRIPGDEKSEGSEVACFEVDENAGVVVACSEASVEEVLRGGGGDFKLFNENQRVLFPIRCLCNMNKGMASARLVPMNCGYMLSVEKARTSALTADIGSHIELLVCRDVEGDGVELIDLCLSLLIAKLFLRLELRQELKPSSEKEVSSVNESHATQL